MFIVIDGPDFTGKSTVVKLLSERLTDLGFDVVTCNDPNSELTYSKQIRQFLLNKTEKCDLAELLMFCAARAELNEKVINPALAAGKVVITDRYIPSTVAYQIYGRDNYKYLDIAVASEWSVESDFTFILTVNDAVRAERMAKRGDKIDELDKLPEEFLAQVNNGYASIVGRKVGVRSHTIRAIDTSNITPDDVVAQMVRHLITAPKRKQ